MLAQAAGNYAPALLPNRLAAAQGCPITLYLDAQSHQYGPWRASDAPHTRAHPRDRLAGRPCRFVEEFNSSNFVGITHDGVYVTPKSLSILAGITNASLMALASSWGIPVEHRPIPAAELRTFVEVGAVGALEGGYGQRAGDRGQAQG